MDLINAPLRHPSYLDLYRYRVHMTVLEDIYLFSFTGSAIRGLFGTALHAVSCHFEKENKPCEQCTLSQNCAYAYFYSDDKPAPFAIVPLSDDPGRYHRQEEMIRFHAGQLFSFEFILYGKANQYLRRSVMNSFMYFRNLPVGMKHPSSTLPAKGRMSLHSIETIGEDEESYVLFANNEFIRGIKPQRINGISLMKPDRFTDVSRITIKTVTPLELRIKNYNINAETGLPFGIFYLQLLQRVCKLANIYGGAPEVPYINTNEPVEPFIANDSYHFHDVRFNKYSLSQEQMMKLHGITGEARFSGELQPYLPLLNLGQYILAGKNTTFGFGKYLLSYEKPL